MAKSHEEWLKQADYDMDTAEFMLQGGRRVYAIFMCHLSIEKALKAVYLFRIKEVPPKTHNLVLLMERIGEKPPPDIMIFLATLNAAHVTTSYPEDLTKLNRVYAPGVVKRMFAEWKESLGVDKNAAVDIVRQYGQAVERQGIHISRIVLYGSYAKGNWHDGSDIDIVVISDDFASKGYWDRIDVLARATCEVWKPIEAVAMTPKEWEQGDSMVVDFARDGEVVFAD